MKYKSLTVKVRPEKREKFCNFPDAATNTTGIWTSANGKPFTLMPLTILPDASITGKGYG
jgi:hypothetical protein